MPLPAKSTRLVLVFPIEHVIDRVPTSWQDLDACDASFMSPKRIGALKTLLSHPDISLLTLNSPHPFMNGVIPLCMAAWLNQPQAVRALLDVSVDTVSVDGMDAHGATALMCELCLVFDRIKFLVSPLLQIPRATVT